MFTGTEAGLSHSTSQARTLNPAFLGASVNDWRFPVLSPTNLNGRSQTGIYAEPEYYFPGKWVKGVVLGYVLTAINHRAEDASAGAFLAAVFNHDFKTHGKEFSPFIGISLGLSFEPKLEGNSLTKSQF